VQEDRKAKAQLFGKTTESELASSPTKPPGILMTPGTAGGRRKQVTFGEKVVDNEGRRKSHSLSGLPDDYPGKFPSPFTPKVAAPTVSVGQVQGKAETGDRSLDARLKEALSSVTNGKPKNASITTWSSSISGTNAWSKGDNDITTDMSPPHSASGRYWKEQYETYSTRSEAELNRLIAKHRIAKDYARMKDEEVTALKAQLETERRKRQERERGLEGQIKDLRERLRLSMAENARISTEVGAWTLPNDGAGGLSGQKGSHQHDMFHDLANKPEPVIEGYKDVEIPIGARKLPDRGRAMSETTKMESSGQDIWLDNESSDFRRPARKLAKPPMEASPITPRTRASWSSHADPDVPLSSRAIREKLVNPMLTTRSANIISKMPKMSLEDPQDILKGLASVNAGTPIAGSTRGRSPRSGEKRSGASISDKRKDNALARIEARRKNRRDRA
jgi:hypothetical protein